MAYLRLGWIESNLGNLALAEELQRQSLQLATAEGWQEGMAHAYGNLGKFYGTRGDLDRAEDMQLKALKLNEELGRKEGMAAA